MGWPPALRVGHAAGDGVRTRSRTGRGPHAAMARRTVCQNPRVGRQDAPVHPSPVPDRIPASQAGFLDDVGRVLRAWRTAPLLPAVTVGVGVLQLLAAVEQPAVALVSALLALLLLGWPCAERVWLLRLWTGRQMTLGQAWRGTMRCFGRMFVLGLVSLLGAALLLLPLGIALTLRVQVDPDGALTLPGGEPPWVAPYVMAVTLVGYCLLTFVTPALAYSSRRVRDALRIGVRLLRVSLPQTAAYVLLPALVAAGGTALTYRGLDAAAVVATVLSAALLALGRGATAAYYVRTVPGAGPDGAVQIDPTPGYYPPSGW